MSAATHPQQPSAEHADWLVGLATVCTTPDVPVWMHGYACEPRFRPFDGKLQDLHAKALAIQDTSGHSAVLITIDLCVLRATEAEAIFRRITDRTGLDHSRVLLNLSHTHSGPVIGESDANRYPMTDAERQATIDYAEALTEKLADVAHAALADLAPARLSLGTGEVDFVRNRRVFDGQGRCKTMGPNPEGYTDPRVPVLRVDAPDGTVRALVFGLACHAVTLGSDSLVLSGDYPGFAQQRLEERFPGTRAMFVQGCGADANSHPRACPDDQVEWAQKQGASLAGEVARVAGGSLRPIRGPLSTELTWADLPLQQIPRDQLEQMAEGPDWQSYNAQRMLDLLDRGETPPTSYRAPLALWQFGGDLTLVGISGETVSGYGPLVEQGLGRDKLWVAGYCNQVFGYLPTAQVVAEGGYEARGTVADIGFFAAHAQDVVVAAVRQMAEKAGRPLSARGAG